MQVRRLQHRSRQCQHGSHGASAREERAEAARDVGSGRGPGRWLRSTVIRRGSAADVALNLQRSVGSADVGQGATGKAPGKLELCTLAQDCDRAKTGLCQRQTGRYSGRRRPLDPHFRVSATSDAEAVAVASVLNHSRHGRARLVARHPGFAQSARAGRRPLEHPRRYLGPRAAGALSIVQRPLPVEKTGLNGQRRGKS
jgi:hypothetical protein